MKTKTLILLLIVSINTFSQAQKRILIKESIDEKSKIPYYTMYFYDASNKKFEVLKLENMDYMYDFAYDFTYKKGSLSYECYTIYDQVDGLSVNVIFDTKTKQFYKTEKYDLHALGDKIQRDAVDFNKLQATVQTRKTVKGDFKPYKIKLIPLKMKPLLSKK